MYLLLVSATSSTQHQHEVETQERSNSVLANQVRQSGIHVHHVSKYLLASTEHLLKPLFNYYFPWPDGVQRVEAAGQPPAGL